jgi:hypothetical protein
MATTMSKAKTTTTDSKGSALFLQLTETKEHGYYHLRARVCTQHYFSGEASEWKPYGVDDDYSDGLLWSGLQVSCQGDEQSQRRSGEAERGAVYGFGVVYADVHTVELRKVRRMAKTLEKIERGLDKLQQSRGYVRSYGEYLGRVAEVLGCGGFCIEREKEVQARIGQRWNWLTVGEGVNAANHRIYLWQQLVANQEAAS